MGRDRGEERRGEEQSVKQISGYLTIRLLVASARRGTAKLLRLTAARVGDQQRTIVAQQQLFDLALRRFIHVCIQPELRNISHVASRYIDYYHNNEKKKTFINK
jgi:hypothetical protein